MEDKQRVWDAVGLSWARSSWGILFYLGRFSVCPCLSPCSLTGVDLVERGGWYLSVTLPGEGQGVRWDKAAQSCFLSSWWRPNSVILLKPCWIHSVLRTGDLALTVPGYLHGVWGEETAPTQGVALPFSKLKCAVRVVLGFAFFFFFLTVPMLLLWFQDHCLSSEGQGVFKTF